MAYIVQAGADVNGESVASVTLPTREQALALGIRWVEDKASDVRIFGDGRIYSVQELVLAIVNRDG